MNRNNFSKATLGILRRYLNEKLRLDDNLPFDAIVWTLALERLEQIANEKPNAQVASE